MATESTTGNEPLTNGGSTSTPSGRMDARQVAGNVASQAGNVAAQAPAAMSTAMETAQAALNESAMRIQSSPDEMLAIGTALSTGIAIGLILGGAPRLLVGAALIPSAAMGFTLLGRYTEMRPRTMGNGRSAKAAAG